MLAYFVNSSILHELRGKYRDENEKNAVEQQIQQVEIFAIGVPLHLKIFLA